MLENGVPAHSILALTFTNKAAAQMRDRLQEMVAPYLCRYISMGTFHSIFSRIIRENAELLGYPSTYTIFQPSDAKSLIKNIIKEMGLPEERYKPTTIISRISYAKNALITPSTYAANAEFTGEDRELKIPQFAEIYARYCNRCKASGALDFDDLLLQTNILFRDFPEVLAKYQQKFQYILVDEYQDTNYAQYIIIRRLSQKHGRVCVVGDDAQSIYSFRGAKIENILNFRKHFPAAKTFKLEQNYRSTQTIVDAANSLISHNKTKLDKRCFSEGDQGEKIRVMRALNDREEAQIVAEEILRRIRENNASFDEIAILYRTNSQSQSLEQALLHRAIPYKIHKGNSFYEHKEIKDMLAYIRLIINPRDDEAFRRIVNYPVRGIGNTTIDRIEALAKERNVSMWEAIDLLVNEDVTDPVQRTIARKVRQFVEMIRDLSAQRTEHSLYDFGLLIANRSGILPSLRLAPASESQSAIENIEELLNTMQRFTEQFEEDIINDERLESEVPTIEEWLQNVLLLTDQESDEESEFGERVTLMTVHSSKGLEYDYIFVVGVEHKLFPSQRAIEMGEIEEERRLFYVAITRAKRAATISYCDMRYKWGNTELTYPSSFITEIDPKYLDIDSNAEIGAKEWAKRPPKTIPDARETTPNRSFSTKPKATHNTPPATPNRNPTGMRSIGVRQQSSEQNPNISSKYSVGDRVMHDHFGRGSVSQISMTPSGEMLTISFESVGDKRLIAKFAPIKKI